MEINYLNLSLTGILKLNFVAYFLLREKFETTHAFAKTTEKVIRLNFYINQMCDVTFPPKSWENRYVTVHDYRRRFADPYNFEFGSGTQTSDDRDRFLFEQLEQSSHVNSIRINFGFVSSFSLF